MGLRNPYSYFMAKKLCPQSENAFLHCTEEGGGDMLKIRKIALTASCNLREQSHCKGLQGKTSSNQQLLL